MSYELRQAWDWCGEGGTAMGGSSVTDRADEEAKRRAFRIAEDSGFDLSSVTRTFYLRNYQGQRDPSQARPPGAQRGFARGPGGVGADPRFWRGALRRA
ncbi:hypothetical protein GCM10011612_08450 [Actinomyces gaoshouyii]|uniref:Uncharacterized protein n=1 Tax=Actinomyces gaoshouyii TaxID=1960083 RepID=A0A8H9H801_9ACTO|nr:hypothetical protein GCM10011612_08450 [Actinomyces gaoshouyii]